MASSMTSKTQADFMYLFERVGEPLYFGPRGQKNTYYMVSTDNLDAKTKHAASEFRKKMAPGSTSVSVKKPSNIPNLSSIGSACPKSTLFSYFIPAHRNGAQQLKSIFMNQKTMDDFLSIACVCRDSEMINPRLWIYAFASSALQRPDLKGFKMPAFWEIAPDQFISPNAVRMAQRQAVLPEQDRSRIIVDRNFTGDDSNPENRLAYFREDLGVNSHHWHWHLIYPTNAPLRQRDRKGELFYYMHHNIIARYEAERLSNGLSRVVRLDLTEQIPEGYFPKLYNTNSGIIWGSRQENTRLQSVERSADPRAPITLDFADLNKWYSRIIEAIDIGAVIGENGQRIPLTPQNGIDILGDIIENADITPNLQLYGAYHNMGHVAIAFSHDPSFRHRENMGVMGDVTTAMRDPVFYRWHKHIDEIFDKYKGTLTPYTTQELVWQGIRVTGLSVQTPSRPVNTLMTNWMQSDIDLARGLDFGRTNENNLGPIWAAVTHLNHERFNYRISITNGGQAAVVGTVRIFMAPRLDERRRRFDLASQRPLFFEMDKFSTNLRPGENSIVRESFDSSISIPWEQSFRELERSIESPSAPQSICGCGWPQHMLIPKGTEGGVSYDLYVIVTNGQLDQVVRRNVRTEAERQGCRDSVSFCGLLDELYPDARPMGYPFDRHPRTANNRPMPNLDAFVQDVPNSRAIEVKILHREVVTQRGNGAPAGMSTVNVGSAPSSPSTSPPPSPRPSPPPSPTNPSNMRTGKKNERPPSRGNQNEGNRGSGGYYWPGGSRSPSPPSPGWANVQPNHRHRGWGEWGK